MVHHGDPPLLAMACGRHRAGANGSAGMFRSPCERDGWPVEDGDRLASVDNGTGVVVQVAAVKTVRSRIADARSLR